MGLYDTSAIPAIVEAGSNALSSVANGTGYLKDLFDSAARGPQQVIMGFLGLFAGGIVGNWASSLTGTQGTWTGTAMKWGVALAALTFFTSDLNPMMKKTDGSPASWDKEAVAPRDGVPAVTNPWTDRDGDGKPDRPVTDYNNQGILKPGW